ncbi:MAG: dihydropteroate synthase [Pseudomonadota bacterium]|nr:dihydropteroate synthase [Pseudomonadota bacterium]
MGVLNVTPDSFSDGGRFVTLGAAIEQAESMQAEGAAIIDVGGESTRPGASPVSEREELDRVIPVIEVLSQRLHIPVSVDTSKPAVMKAAVAAGAGMINDVRALTEPGAIDAAIASDVPVCLMHMQGEPRTMQLGPSYRRVVNDVVRFLTKRVECLMDAGFPQNRMILDPGFGFGKTLEHNLELLADLESIADLGFPVMVGLSRKSMIGRLLRDRPVGERVFGSVAATVLAVERGARLVRVHDVLATCDALKVCRAVMEADRPPEDFSQEKATSE